MSPDQRTARRKRQLAKIHILAAQKGMDTRDKSPDSVYRLMLKNVGGADSAAKLSDAGISAVLARLSGRTVASASTPQARLIRHIWGSLHDAGEVKTIDGLNAWLRKTTARYNPQDKGWDRPEFLPRHVSNKVVEQLKKWAFRLDIDWEEKQR